MMWVILRIKDEKDEHGFMIGFYDPKGEFIRYYYTNDILDAERVCHYLNGGN